MFFFFHFNILVDHTRVELKDVDKSIAGSEYINANFIRQPWETNDSPDSSLGPVLLCSSCGNIRDDKFPDNDRKMAPLISSLEQKTCPMCKSTDTDVSAYDMNIYKIASMLCFASYNTECMLFYIIIF